MMGILRRERASRKPVYVLVGNEPVASCYERAMKVIELRGEPFCQFLKPLNWLGDERLLRCRFDWTVQHGKDFCRFFNWYLWRSPSSKDYRPRHEELSPFVALV
jgi:hypothetical protein